MTIALVVAGVRLVTRSDSARDGSGTQSPTQTAASQGRSPTAQSCDAPSADRYYRTDRSLAIDPHNPEHLFVGVEYRGAYQSTDGGATWTTSMKDVRWTYGCFPEPFKAAFSPDSSQVIYLSSNGDGILQTTDGGRAWTRLYSSSMYPRSEEFAFDPSNPQVMYATAENIRNSPNPADNSNVTRGLVYKSSDGGSTWTELTTPLTANAGNSGVIVSRSDPRHLLAFTILVHHAPGGRQADTSGQLGILESRDAGATWRSLHTIPAGYDAIASVFSSSADPRKLYVTPFTIPGARQKGFVSTDFGQSWAESAYMGYVAYDPHDAGGDHALGFTSQLAPGAVGQLYETNDAGRTWHPSVALPAEITDFADHRTLVSEIQWDPRDPRTLYLSAASAYLWRSSDSGRHWHTMLSLDRIPAG